jgi:phosphotransferase system HPr (HPr) family protein
MIETEMRVINRLGLHARPAVQFVQKANEFPCDIVVVKGEKKANAKSISRLMNLKIRQNDLIRITAEGEGEKEALSALTHLLSSEGPLS